MRDVSATPSPPARAPRSPLARLDARWTPHPRTVRRAALTALVMSVAIIITGGAVRLTGSGLGCDTWPRCTGDSLVTTAEMGWHGVIEFGNRMLTYVVSAAVGWSIIASRCASPRRPGLTRLAWGQFWVVLSNALIGGVTVLTGLNPYIVAAHFLAALALVTMTTLTWLRTREGDATPRPLVGLPIRRAVLALTVLTGVLMVAGTAVTGSGRHAGDNSEEIMRMPFDWEVVTRVHTVIAWAVALGVLVTVILLRLIDAPPGPRARARDLMALLVLQGVIGYVQYALDEPPLLVGFHMLGSVLVWIATLRLLLSLRERGPAPGADPPETARPTAASAPGAPDGVEASDGTEASDGAEARATGSAAEPATAPR